MYIDPTNINATEGTQFVSEDVKFEQPVENLAEENNYYQDAAPQTQKSSGTWKGVLIGGFPGIALGAAGAILANSGILHAGETPDPEPDPNPADVPVYEQAPIATVVNDDMSFAEAFGAAREELGAGGVFVWHGQIYSTYNAEEWNAMTPEQQSSYTQSLSGITAEPTPEPEPQPEPTPEPEPEPTPEPQPEPEPEPTPEPGTFDPLAGEITINAVGEYDNADGSIGNAAVGTIDGLDATFVDVDADGVVDGVLVDVDNNGEFTQNEVYNLQDSGLTIDDLAAMAGNNGDGLDDIITDNTDYTNDGDTSSLC